MIKQIITRCIQKNFLRNIFTLLYIKLLLKSKKEIDKVVDCTSTA